MGTLAYPYSVRDSANTGSDNRKTGLTPTVSNGKTLAASPATVSASAVTTVEIGAGDYVFLYDAEANGDASFPVDWGAALTNPNDRYGTLILTRDPGRIVANLDAAVSTRSTFAGGAVASVTAPVAVAAAGLDAVIVEPAVAGGTQLNARQMLALLGAEAAGKLAGANGSTTTIAAAGNPTVTRITAATDPTGRTSVTLNPPA